MFDVFANEKVRGLLIFTFGLIALATISFRLIEGWAWIDALFFAVTTISTVGYGDITPQTTPGKVVTMVYILLGLGVFVAATSSVAEVLIKRREQVRERNHPQDDSD
jgi:voltage-gated potassium channel Kch